MSNKSKEVVHIKVYENQGLDQEYFLKSTEDKIKNLEKLLQNFKINFQNIGEKKNRIFEDDLMKIELVKDSVLEYKNKFNAKECKKSIVEHTLQKYENAVNELLNKYSY